MKKILALTLSVSIAATALVGCSNTDSESEISDTSSISEVTETAAEPVTEEKTTESVTEKETTKPVTEEETTEPTTKEEITKDVLAKNLFIAVNKSFYSDDVFGDQGAFWFDSDKNVVDDPDDWTDFTDEMEKFFTQGFYSEMLNEFPDIKSYKWVVYGEDRNAKTIYISDSFDSNTVYTYYFERLPDSDESDTAFTYSTNDGNEVADMVDTEVKNKTLNEIKQDIDNEDKVTVEQFEERLSALIKECGISELNIHEETSQLPDNMAGSLDLGLELVVSYISEETIYRPENVRVYTYGDFLVTVSVGKSGGICHLSCVSNDDYMHNIDNDNDTKLALLKLNLMPYAAMYNYDIDEVDKLIDLFGINVKKEYKTQDHIFTPETYKDVRYSYAFNCKRYYGDESDKYRNIFEMSKEMELIP